MRLLAPLRLRPVRTLWAGLATSAIGDQAYNVSLSWVAIGALGAAAGYLSAVQAACVLLATTLGGRWADAWDPARAIAVACTCAAAVLLSVFGYWWATGRTSVAGLLLTVVVLAGGVAVVRPAVQAILPTLLPDRAVLPAANALIDATERIARLTGPALVGLLAPVLPPLGFFAFDALTFLAAAAAVLMLPRTAREASKDAVRPSPPRGVLAATFRGAHALIRVPLLRDAWLTTAGLNGAWFALFYLALPYAIAHDPGSGPGAGLGTFGAVITAYGCTNLLTTLVVGNRDMPRQPAVPVFSSNLVMAAGMALVALAEATLPVGGKLPGYAVGAALAAIGGPMRDVRLAVLRQLRLAPGDVAPSVRAFMASSQMGTLVAMLIAPPVLALAGPAPVMAGCAATIAGLGVFGLLRWRAGAYAGG